MKIGRYNIQFGKYAFIQSKGVAVTSRRFLGFWIIRESKLTDIDKHPRFLPGTGIEVDGRCYRYVKWVANPNKDNLAKEEEKQK